MTCRRPVRSSTRLSFVKCWADPPFCTIQRLTGSQKSRNMDHKIYFLINYIRFVPVVGRFFSSRIAPGLLSDLMKFSFTNVFFFLLCALSLPAQQTEDAVVPVTVSVSTNPARIQLSWEQDPSTSQLLVIKREKDAPEWYVLGDTAGAGITMLTDTNVEPGRTYEYHVQQIVNGIPSYGYVTVPIQAPVVDHRGTILVFMESALMQPLAAERERLEYDLAGDGWKVIMHEVQPDATVLAIKDQILMDYENDPDQVRAVLLLGECPVPYSGNTAWDGHNDHQGAWPADAFYGDVDGVWSDEVVNNTTPSRPANDNVPGDGKYDHSIAPTTMELAVGRVDFSNLSEATFGTTRVELMRRYLNKDHAWRTGQYKAEKRAIVDDNFGYFGGEAFAANGYRNFYPIVGKDNVQDGDFFNDTENQSFLLGYGCGGGSYSSANGVGNSTNFATKTVNVVFSMLFGSYHGDWDYENNPFMPSALASEGGILSCAWAGRPHWFFHHLAAGETLGYCAVSTQNACENAGYFGSIGSCGAHVALMGDPTLRAQIVDPVENVQASQICQTVQLSWNASTAASPEGYLVYRAGGLHGDYIRLTAAPVVDTFFTDPDPLTGDNFYQVKTVVLEETPSGTFYNTSTGFILPVSFQPVTPPTAVATAGMINCSNPQAVVSVTTDAAQPSFEWAGPGGFSNTGQTILVSEPGTYFVTVTDNATGCNASALATVVLDNNLPGADPAVSGDLTCVTTAVQLSAQPTMPGYTFVWIGPNGFNSFLEEPIVTAPGTYELVVTGTNGCSATFSAEVFENVTLPEAAATGGVLNCLSSEISLDGSLSSSGPNYTYAWTTIDGNIASGANTLNPLVNDCGTYTLVVVDASNGCATSADVAVECDFQAPQLTVDGLIDVPCAGDVTTLTASSATQGTTFFWQGPGIVDPAEPEQVVGTGIFVVTATGQNGCVEVLTLEVHSLSDINVAVSFFVDCEGLFTVDPIIFGGVQPYSIVISPLNPMPSGTPYTISVTDAIGCSVEMTGTTGAFVPLSVEIDHTDESILGMADGSATASPMNGSAPYTYSWSNGATTPTITDLAPGTYTVTITDSNGCTAVESVEIQTGVLASDEEKGITSLVVYPNPTGGPFRVGIELQQPQRLSLEVLDLNGHSLIKYPPVFVPAQTWMPDLSGFPDGIYLCRIRIGDQAIYRKAVKIKD